MADPPNDPPKDETKPAQPEPDLDLEPVGRDRRFIYRLVLLVLVGAIAAAFLGIKLKGLAAGCGSGLVRPGTSVIPPGDASGPSR